LRFNVVVVVFCAGLLSQQNPLTIPGFAGRRLPVRWSSRG
jgi:hypothetical protein